MWNRERSESMRHMHTKITMLIILCVMLTVIVFFMGGCGSANAGESGDFVKEKHSSGADLDVSGGSIFTAAQKDETVTASGDATGKIASIIDEVTLSGFTAESGDYVEDVTNLREIKNKEGAEEYLQEGDSLYWENLGDTITYQGTSDEELPVGVTITYYLDGQEVTPEEIAGASGLVKIRMDYVNVNAGTEDYVPYLTLSMLVLDSDHFSDIEVDGGKVISYGDSQVAVGLSVPGLGDYLDLESYDEDINVGLQDYVEITAQAEDFSLDFTATIVTNGLLEDIEDEDLEDFDDITEDMEDLGDAADEIEDAAEELLSGSQEFSTYLKQYTDGTDALADGIAALNNSMKDMPTAAAGLSQLAAYSDSVKQLASYASTLNAMAAQYQAAGDATTAAQFQALATALSSMEDLGDALGELDDLSDGLSALCDGVSQLNTGAQQLKTAGASLNSGYKELTDGISEFADGIEEFNDEGIQELVELGDDDLSDLLTKIRVLRAADQAVGAYSGATAGTKTSVKYIIETDGINCD